MKPLIIAGVDKESGKTVVALGIALNHQGKVEYVKPLRGELIKVDREVYERDAKLVQQVLNLEATDKEISPIDLEPHEEQDLDSLIERMQSMAKEADLLLVEAGTYAESGLCTGVSAFDLATKLDGEMLLVMNADVGLFDRVLLLKEFADQRGAAVKGVVVNNAKDDACHKLIEGYGLDVVGSIPFEPRLRCFRVREILDVVGGECVAGSKGLDRVVEKVVIGAFSAESALPHMRRIPRKCVITGGDRSDLLMAALSTDTSCLVCTGGMRPTAHVLSEAHEQGVPVIVISGDTYSVAERFEGLEVRINPDDEDLVERVKELVRDNLDLERLFSG
jgi:BioD-like phosphotransacetylase family protein